MWAPDKMGDPMKSPTAIFMNIEKSEISAPSFEELGRIIERAILDFRGNSERLKSAIGMLMLVRSMGWKPMFLMHSRGTIKEYEDILGVNIRSMFPPLGPLANKSAAWRVVASLSNFWKAVKGEYLDKKTKSTELV